jgi:hypothetical protein
VNAPGDRAGDHERHSKGEKHEQDSGAAGFLNEAGVPLAQYIPFDRAMRPTG